jgi:hypothetical protein
MPTARDRDPQSRAMYLVDVKNKAAVVNGQPEMLAHDLSKEPPDVIEAAIARLPQAMRENTGRVLASIHMVEAARVHGQTRGRLDTLQQDIMDLSACRQGAGSNAPYTAALLDTGGGRCRPFSLESAQIASGDIRPIQQRVDEINKLVAEGRAEKDQDRWTSTVLDHALDKGLITSQADLERFKQIAEYERTKEHVKWAAWHAVGLGLALFPARAAGPGIIAFARAPQTPSVVLNAANGVVRAARIDGSYQNVAEFMSLRAMRFQEKISGGLKAGTSFVRGGVRFDFVDTTRRVLVDAKGPGYANFVDKTGKFRDWFPGTGLVDQARRQLRAAGGMPVEWVFAEREAMEATRDLLARKGITGIMFRLHS